MRPWHFGNTTVRSPFRLRDGLIVLANSPLLGRIKGKENENEFARLLHRNNVVNITRAEADVSDLGRKWRAALSQLGFVVPEVDSRRGLKQEWVGEPFTLTDNGKRLIVSDSVPAMQECFLRSLAAYYIPSALEQDYDFTMFSPLRYALAIMLKLANTEGEDHLTFLEMGLFVQLTNFDDDLDDVVESIISFRSKRNASGNKRRYDQTAIKHVANKCLKPGGKPYEPNSFLDYADLNIRYLKATGLVQSKGHGVTLVPEKNVFIRKLVEDRSIPDSDREYLACLCRGAKLPTDNKVAARVVLDDLLEQLKRKNIPFDIRSRKLDNAGDMAVVRYEIEELLSHNKEEEYALQQASEWQEIAEYMELVIERSKRRRVRSGQSILIPQGEVPAYFEWILWRAFLAINSLVNKPYEARRFKIDQDFLPVGTAPGGGPDLIFEFENFSVVVEVTLTEGSRQEAVEGEPVRRHVAEQVARHMAASGKPVWGLFLANKIDSNTAETFRVGVWFAENDRKMRLDIVPLTLAQFRSFFCALFSSGRVDANLLHDVLFECNMLRSAYEGPDWKRQIESYMHSYVRSLEEQSRS